MTVRNLIGVAVLVAVFAACSTVASDGVTFDLGATEFHGGDEIVVEEVRSSGDGFGPGALVTVVGRYKLSSRDAGTLYFGTTTVGASGDRSGGLAEQLAVRRGSGTFELRHRVPGPGHLHVTFYDPESGQPFGGQYFGKGEGLLVSKDWAYAR